MTKRPAGTSFSFDNFVFCAGENLPISIKDCDERFLLYLILMPDFRRYVSVLVIEEKS